MVRRFRVLCAVAAMAATWLAAVPGASATSARPDGVRSPASIPTASIHTDYTPDAYDDVLWYSPNGSDSLWQFGPAGPSGVASSPLTQGPGFEPIPGDFDGDGATDVLWYRPGPGDDPLWTDVVAGPTVVSRPVSGAYIPAAGDFDGNGYTDIFWYAPGAAEDSIWFFDADGFASEPMQVLGSYLPLVGDFDGDGVVDVFWYAPGPAPDALWFGTPGGAFEPTEVRVTGSYRPLVGDFDDDGVHDVFWYAAGPPADSIWFFDEDGGFASQPKVLTGTYVPIVGDFDGPGADDILLYAPGTVQDYLWHAEPDGFRSEPVTLHGDYVPVGRARTYGPAPSIVTPTAAYATAGGVTLHHPAKAVHYIGFHQSADRSAVMQDPAATIVRHGTMPSRGRGTGSRTAADVVPTPGTAILSPVTGTVVRVRPYRLYCNYPDLEIGIRPDQNPGLELVALHMIGPKVTVGQRVQAGVTPIAEQSRRFGFASQVDEYSGRPNDGHVHLELVGERDNPATC